MERLILWDLDGTLLSTDGIAAAAMRAALREVVGPDIPVARTAYAGKTDWQIIRDSLPDLPLATISERLHEFKAAYLSRLEGQQVSLAARSQVYPGVVAILEALGATAYQAPLTGNIAAAARLKLASVNLLHLLDLEAGAYGDDHYHRPELVPIAVRRAEARYGQTFSGSQIVVVGDTPHDIACGRANGARTVAVATGPFDLDSLIAEGPDVALSDLRDTNAAIAAVLGGVR